ncbi:hypothetical protein FQN54_007666 [Arachnomyces sp. PD_36]|nr:hypothetical protein FQN54_007666 [Arachnomyces sp. PD_36]
MFAKPSTPAAVPSRGALRILRQLALAGSTIGAIGGVCTVATITYDVHRRVHLAERIVQNKRNLQVSCPNYDARGGMMTVEKMMEAAEAGEFMGLDSMRDRKKRKGAKGSPGLTKAKEEQLSVRKRVRSAEKVDDAPTRSSLVGEQTSTPGTIWQSISIGSGSGGTPTPRKLRIGPTRASLLQPKINLASHPSSIRIRPKPTLGSKLPLRYQDTQIASPLVRIRELLDRDKPIEAAQLFLEAHPASISAGISPERRELASKVFYANIKAENVFLARNVFHRIDAIDKITPALWEVLILALGKRGCYDSVATLYIDYSKTFDISPTLLKLVLRSLIDSYNLKEAKTMMFKNLNQDRGCGLCGIYLSGIWKKTRSIQLMVSQFEKLLDGISLSGAKPTERLFNPLLRAYIDVGKDEEAQLLAEKMESQYNISLETRTRGLFVYAKAIRCDWEGVDSGFQELYDLGLPKKQPKDFSKIFDRIFLQFWLANSGPAIRDFIFRAIDKYGLVPDQILFNHILEAYVEKGDSEMVGELMATVEKHSWNIKLDKRSFMEMIRRRRLAADIAPVGLWHMFKASQEKFGQASTSHRILGYDRTSFPDNEAYKMPWTSEPIDWWRRAMSMSEPTRGIDQFASLNRQMFHAMNAGKWSDALTMYTTAKRGGKVFRQVHVELAIIASIIHTGCTDEARMILEDEIENLWKSWKDYKTVMPIFLQQVLQSHEVSEIAGIKMASLHFYSILEKRLLPCKHHAVAGVSARLIAKDDHAAAVDLLTTIYKSRFGSAVKFDGVVMKLFVRAFAGVGNLNGIKWGICSALKRPSALNRDFVVEAHRVIAALQSRPVLAPDQTVEAYHSELNQLREMASLLPEAGDQVSNPSGDFSPTNGNKKDAEQANTASLPSDLPTQSQGTSNDIHRILESWDEELELERALERGTSLPARDDEDWSEDSVWSRHIYES